MMHPTPPPVSPRSSGAPPPTVEEAEVRWRLWQPRQVEDPRLRIAAELSECGCPELCHRDHEND